jgi:uncharacterized protein
MNSRLVQILKNETPEGRSELLGPQEIAFIEARDGFYLSTISASGWPYVQFRGGPPGFIRALDEETLGFADFRGNRQYLTTGNLAKEDRAALFFMDYANRARLKLLGRVSISEDPSLIERLRVDGYRARVERAMLIRVEAFDWNCPAHITPRFSAAELRLHGVEVTTE